jgi:hypothetical protein
MRELAQAFGMVLVLALAMAFGTTSDAADKVYTKELPKVLGTGTKLEALHALVKGEKVYACQEQKLSDKATVVNK